MNYVAVIPSIFQQYTDECVASCKLDNVVVVDNTVNNLGIAGGWNVGVREMYDRGADWTIIISAAVRFGDPGGLDLVEALEQNPDALAVEAGDYNRSSTVYSAPPTRWDAAGNPVEGFGWHLLAIHRRTFDAVGLFDENFWPGYMEDTDFNCRLRNFYGDRINWSNPPYWLKTPVDGTVAYIGHGSDLANVNVNGQMDYYLRKWGGPPLSEKWQQPFNDSPVCFWPQPAPRDLTRYRRGQ